MEQTRSITVLDRPVTGVVRPPGSKSLTNRALIAAALASGGVSRIAGPLDAEDTQAMRAGLRALGVSVEDNDDPWMVLGTSGELGGGTVFAGASGTTARFLTAAATLTDSLVDIDGTQRMRQRPMTELVDALRRLGAHIEGDSLPLRVGRSVLSGGVVTVDGRRSSQFLSAILLLAPMLGEEVLVEPMPGTASASYIAGTLETMRSFHASVAEEEGGFRVAAGGYGKAHVEIEADASAAVYPLVAAAVTGGAVEVLGIPANSSQPDLAVLPVLEAMGCQVEHRGDRITVAGPGGSLEAVDVDMALAPDASLAAAVACLFAAGRSRITGLGTLRHKETDRLQALVTELRRVGAGARVEGDALIVEPGPARPAAVQTYDDHRMAMAFAVAGLRRSGIEIVDPGCVSKTWPGFFAMLEQLGR